MRIVLLGAGNLATALAKAIDKEPQLELVQIYSRSQTSAEALTTALSSPTEPITQLSALSQDADIYIFAIPDKALEEFWAKMPPTTGVWLHTAGSVSLSSISSIHQNSGVIYPLQTFSKEKTIDFSEVPLFLEGSNPKVKEQLQRLANLLSQNVSWASTEQRQILHLAAVLSCNFSNHLIALAEELLAENHLPTKVILPLLEEMMQKVRTMPASKAQTGPAQRGDEQTLAQHEQLLRNKPQWLTLYQLLSQSIKTNKLL